MRLVIDTGVTHRSGSRHGERAAAAARRLQTRLRRRRRVCVIAVRHRRHPVQQRHRQCRRVHRHRLQLEQALRQAFLMGGSAASHCTHCQHCRIHHLHLRQCIKSSSLRFHTGFVGRHTLKNRICSSCAAVGRSAGFFARHAYTTSWNAYAASKHRLQFEKNDMRMANLEFLCLFWGATVCLTLGVWLSQRWRRGRPLTRTRCTKQ